MTSTYKRTVMVNDKTITPEIEDPTLVPDLQEAYGLDLLEADLREEERRLDEYIEAAMQEAHLSSERHLAQILNISPSSITHWRKKRSWPSEKIMIQLADIGGSDPDEALLHLRIWKADTLDAKNAYLTLLRLSWTAKVATEYETWNTVIKNTAAAILLMLSIGFTSSPSNASGTGSEQITTPVPTIYIMRLSEW